LLKSRSDSSSSISRIWLKVETSTLSPKSGMMNEPSSDACRHRQRLFPMVKGFWVPVAEGVVKKQQHRKARRGE
jgi:hypothetical protein